MLSSRLPFAAQVLQRLLPASNCSTQLEGAIHAFSRGLATSGTAAAAAAAAAAASTPPPALTPGSVLTLSKRYSAVEVAAFTAMTGDSNAIHISAAAAASQGLPGAILPGLLMAALFPAIIGSSFPGALYLNQSLKFKQYALVGDEVTATLTVEKASGSRVSFRTLCSHSGTGAVLVEGSALALIRPPAAGSTAASHSAAANTAADAAAADAEAADEPR
ncbi:(R)-specific enoyl- hydratase [Chlorella sorokiniana]|uniref:(R)-specific enoyl-hydratase n=1 Tax=Chlorella sorokiniana TaxID=3076 RepID=A0A2P6TI36_CHLSO|nr:(R)-specific enoyl- hydratase [Chlorella sorokiniana]|eukprot:PRW33937.1 (R)-specific enoyl- hydratase [Chlorella sorokiniana]